MKPGPILWLALALGASSPAVAQAAPVQAILLEPAQPTGALLELWSGPGAVPGRLEAMLDVGDEGGGRVMRLLAADGAADRYRVSVQFETSMGLSGEGPHIDLRDWKHCRSRWYPAPPVGADGFRLPVANDADRDCFPPATRDELRRAVQAAMTAQAWDPGVGRHWLALVDRVPRLGEFPSYVAISTLRVRVEHRVGDAWRVLTTVALQVPMGC